MHSAISPPSLCGSLINGYLDIDSFKAYQHKVANEDDDEIDVVSEMNLTRKRKMETIRGVN